LRNNTTIEGRITQEDKANITVQEPRTNKVYNLKRNEIKLITRDQNEMKELEKMKDVYTHIITLKKNKDLNWAEVKPDKKDDKGNVLPTMLYATIVEKGVNSTTVLDYDANIKVKILNDNIEEMVDIAKAEEVKKKKEEEEEKQSMAGVYSGTASRWRIGLLPSPIMPQGDLAGVLGMGYGVQVFGDMLMPAIRISGMPMQFRGGVSLGYSTFSSSADFDATLTIIPILLYAQTSYITTMGLKPYLSLGVGATMVSMEKKTQIETTSESSIDGTLSIGIGTAYSHRSIPRVDFILGINYMMAFESITGNFLQISIGAGYDL